MVAQEAGYGFGAGQEVGYGAEAAYGALGEGGDVGEGGDGGSSDRGAQLGAGGPGTVAGERHEGSGGGGPGAVAGERHERAGGDAPGAVAGERQVSAAGAYEVLIAYDVEPGYEMTPGSDSGRWANDGDDVVSAGMRPPSLEAMGTVIEHHRDIRTQEMPSVQVPPGEYGKGEWAPEDIRPDGPPGEVDPERRA